MNESIKDYFENGLVKQLFEAWKNFKIWENISNEVSFLLTLEKDKQDLYIFIQQSAQTNFILALSKVFDKKDKQYKTRCLDEFLTMLNKYDVTNDDFNKSKLDITLKMYNNNKLIEASKKPQTKFWKEFSQHYKTKLKDDLLEKAISKIQNIRNKSIAHDEVFIEAKTVELVEIERVMIFINEIITIFSSALGYNWQIEKDAERNSDFVKTAIKNLKIAYK